MLARPGVLHDESEGAIHAMAHIVIADWSRLGKSYLLSFG